MKINSETEQIKPSVVDPPMEIYETIPSSSFVPYIPNSEPISLGYPEDIVTWSPLYFASEDTSDKRVEVVDLDDLDERIEAVAEIQVLKEIPNIKSTNRLGEEENKKRNKNKEKVC